MIEPGRYRTRDGHVAVVTDTGCFAYGYVILYDGSESPEFWDLVSGGMAGYDSEHERDLTAAARKEGT